MTTKTHAEQAWKSLNASGATDATRALLEKATEFRVRAYGQEDREGAGEWSRTTGLTSCWRFEDGSVAIDSDSEYLIHDVIGFEHATIEVDGETIPVFFGVHGDGDFALHAYDFNH